MVEPEVRRRSSSAERRCGLVERRMEVFEFDRPVSGQRIFGTRADSCALERPGLFTVEFAERTVGNDNDNSAPDLILDMRHGETTGRVE